MDLFATHQSWRANTAAPKSLPQMIEQVIADSPLSDNSKALVVMDAGIGTKDNLALIKAKGYNYLCVSRERLKDFELVPSEESVLVHDCKGETARKLYTALKYKTHLFRKIKICSTQ